MVHIFILDPYAGGQMDGYSLDAKLKEIENLEYYIISLRSLDDKEGLVGRIQEFFEDEQLRLYICGQNRTIYTVLNELKSPESVEIAYIPNGVDNDILKVFRKNEDKFRDIEKMVDGNVVKVDYIRTNHGVCLNSVSVGVDYVNETLMNTSFIWDRFGAVHKAAWVWFSFLKAKPKKMSIVLDDVRMEGLFSLLFFGNSFSMAGNLYFSDYTFINDGKGVVSITPALKPLQMGGLLHALRRKNLTTLGKLNKLHYSKRMSLHLEDEGYNLVYLDGVPHDERGDWEVEIVPEGLRFVLPKGVSL
jgi:diacylglycerol kinase family enzyme